MPGRDPTVSEIALKRAVELEVATIAAGKFVERATRYVADDFRNFLLEDPTLKGGK